MINKPMIKMYIIFKSKKKLENSVLRYEQNKYSALLMEKKFGVFHSMYLTKEEKQSYIADVVFAQIIGWNWENPIKSTSRYDSNELFLPFHAFA